MWKLYLALALIGASFGGGYYYGSSQVSEKVTTVKGDTVTVVRDRIVTKTITRQPDGTVTETTKEEEINHNTETRTVSTDTSRGPSSGPQYSAGAGYWMGSSRDVLEGWKYSNVSVNVGRRIIGPVWATVEARPIGDKKEISAGVRIEW